jgi:hypothetical protein
MLDGKLESRRIGGVMRSWGIPSRHGLEDHMKRLVFGVAALLAVSACQTTDDEAPDAPEALASGSVSDISDLEGARAGQAERGLERRGYQVIKTQGLTAYWWNAFTQTCAEIVTDDGRYKSIKAASESDCFF